MGEFAAVFEDLADPRTGNAKRHELPEILLIALGTLLSGGTTCADMAPFGRAQLDFLREFLALRHGVPSHDTFSRAFRLRDPAPMRRFAETRQRAWWRRTAGRRAAPSIGRRRPRAPWDIENGLHRVLDVALDEDQARDRKDHGPENLAPLRRLTLNLARLEPSGGSPRGKLKRAGWDNWS